jgi:hypothetical protein
VAPAAPAAAEPIMASAAPPTIAVGGAGAAPIQHRSIIDIVDRAVKNSSLKDVAPPTEWGTVQLDWKTAATAAFGEPFKAASKLPTKEHTVILETTDISVMHDAIFNARSKHFNTEGLTTFISEMTDSEFTDWLQDKSIRDDCFTIYWLLKHYVPFFFGENMVDSSIKYMKFTAANIIKPSKKHSEKEHSSLYTTFGVEAGEEPANTTLRHVAVIQTMQNALINEVCKLVSKFAGHKSAKIVPNGLYLEFDSKDALTTFSKEILYNPEDRRLRYPPA